MMILSDLRQPVQDYQGSTVCGWLLQLLISSLRAQQSYLSTTGQGRIPPGFKAIFSFWLLPFGGEWSAWTTWLLQCGGWLSTRIPAATLSVLSPKPPFLVSPPAFWVYFAHIPNFLEPRVSDCKWKFMHWPFKPLFASLAVDLWQRATMPLFTAGCYLCTFHARVL